MTVHSMDLDVLCAKHTLGIVLRVPAAAVFQRGEHRCRDVDVVAQARLGAIEPAR